MPVLSTAPARSPRLEHGSPPLTNLERTTEAAERLGASIRSPGGPIAVAIATTVLLLTSSAGSAQQAAPVIEDGDLPPAGQLRLRAGPTLQTWHQEFGPGTGDGRLVPLEDDWSGPLVERFHPGPGALVEDLNRDAGALGFEPLDPSDASLGRLEVKEISREIRTLAVRLEVGLPWNLAADVHVPLVRTEVEPFGTFDPSGATLGSAAGVLSDPGSFLGTVSAARSDLRSRLESGELSAGEAERASELLMLSGAFADALVRRVREEELVPLTDTPAGQQVLAHYASLRDGFASFGLSLPELSLPDQATNALLEALPSDPLSAVQRGWLVGEPEFGVRFRVHDGFRPGETRQGLQLRTAVGVRARIPFRPANSTPFVLPSDLLGLGTGDGQTDVELSLYQDLRWRDFLTMNAIVRYGVQRPDRLTVRVRSPDRPLAGASSDRRVERDLGDYLRLRLAPRLVLNRFFSLGGEYRFWRKGDDRYRVLEGSGDASALELETSETRHRLGVGAFYRPDPPEEGEPRGGAPELGMIWQTALAGSGGEVPAANLVTFHLRVPIHLF